MSFLVQLFKFLKASNGRRKMPAGFLKFNITLLLDVKNPVTPKKFLRMRIKVDSDFYCFSAGIISSDMLHISPDYCII